MEDIGIMAEKIRKEKDKCIFISFEQGASGHKLARVLATCLLYTSPSPRDP